MATPLEQLHAKVYQACPFSAVIGDRIAYITVDEAELLLKDLWARTKDRNWVLAYADAIENGGATLFNREIKLENHRPTPWAVENPISDLPIPKKPQAEAATSRKK